MSETQTAPKPPSLALRVLYVSTAGRSIVNVTPDGDKISIGGKTARCDHEHIFPGGKKGGKFDAIYIEGHDQCVPVYGAKNILSPEWADALAHTNIVKQLHDIASGGKKERIAWTPIIMNGLLIIAVAAVGIILHGDVQDMHDDLVASHPSLQPPPQAGQNDGDTTVVNGHNANGSG